MPANTSVKVTLSRGRRILEVEHVSGSRRRVKIHALEPRAGSNIINNSRYSFLPFKTREILCCTGVVLQNN